MNERMNQLQTEAARYAKEKYPSDIVKWSLCMSEKFAELIVRECADFANDHNSEVEGVTLGVGRALKQHFGVEE